MIANPVIGQKVWFVVMAQDKIVSGNVIAGSITEDGHPVLQIRATFGKRIWNRKAEFTWTTAKEAREFYETWKIETGKNV